MILVRIIISLVIAIGVVVDGNARLPLNVGSGNLSENQTVNISGDKWGKITGTALYLPGADSGFRIEQLIDIHVGNLILLDNFNLIGWFTAHYKDPEIIPINNCGGLVVTYNTPLVANLSDGYMPQGRDSYKFHFYDLYPVRTMIQNHFTEPYPVCGEIFYTHEMTNKVSWLDPVWGSIDYIHNPDWPYVEFEKSGDKIVDLKWNMEGYDEDGTLLWDVELSGTFYTIHEFKEKVFRKRRQPGDPEEKVVQPGDKIKTDEHTRLKIEIPDGGEIILNPETEVEILDEWPEDWPDEWRSTEEDQIVLEQIRGELMLRTKGITCFRVVPPQAVAGVRGTEFISSVYENGTNTIIVLDGSVEVFDRFSDKSIIVEANQMAIVTPDSFPSAAVELESDYPEWRFITSAPAKIDIPEDYRLYQNYPNPFNASTTIRYSLPERTHTSLTVYDILGRRVKSLVEGELDAGMHTATFNAHTISSGVYYYRLRAGDVDMKRKMLYLR